MKEETQNKIARTSNVVGQVAGIAGLGAAATNLGDKLPKKSAAKKVIGKIPTPVADWGRKHKKGATALAAGGLALQAGNVIGDAVTTKVLARADRETKAKKQGVSKSAWGVDHGTEL